MSSVDYSTEKPYVLATKSDARKADFYTVEAATAAVKVSRGTRKLYGRHRGHWTLLATYVNGVRQCIPSTSKTLATSTAQN